MHYSLARECATTLRVVLVQTSMPAQCKPHPLHVSFDRAGQGHGGCTGAPIANLALRSRSLAFAAPWRLPIALKVSPPPWKSIAACEFHAQLRATTQTTMTTSAEGGGPQNQRQREKEGHLRAQAGWGVEPGPRRAP